MFRSLRQAIAALHEACSDTTGKPRAAKAQDKGIDQEVSGDRNVGEDEAAPAQNPKKGPAQALSKEPAKPKPGPSRPKRAGAIPEAAARKTNIARTAPKRKLAPPSDDVEKGATSLCLKLAARS